MNNFLKTLFLFFISAIVFYLLLIIIWGQLMPAFTKKNLNYSLGAYGHMHTRLQEVEKYKNIDILFIGSSHAYRGFDTRVAAEYGYTSFNLGSSAQTPVQTKLLLDRYLDNLQPKIIVYEVYPYTFEIDGVESSLDIIANGKIDQKVLSMALTLNNIKTYNSLLYGIYRHTFNLDKNFNESIVIAKDTYIPGGYVQRILETNTNSLDNKAKTVLWMPRKYQLNAFEKTVTQIKSRGIKLILVQAPITKNAYINYNNDSINRYFTNKAIYYNFNGCINLSDTADFYNADHLNQKGVIIFNTILMNLIKRNK